MARGNAILGPESVTSVLHPTQLINLNTCPRSAARPHGGLDCGRSFSAGRCYRPGSMALLLDDEAGTAEGRAVASFLKSPARTIISRSAARCRRIAWFTSVAVNRARLRSRTLS